MQRSFFTRLWIYQKERFPLSVIPFTTLAVLLSTRAISSAAFPPLFIVYMTLLFYLAHLRIADEFKDYQHDLKHYAQRPVPRGLVTRKELAAIFVGLVAAQLLLNLLANSQIGFLFYLLALGYSLLAAKEFFIRDWLRPRLLLYNLVHFVQLVLVQIYVYASFWPVRPDLLAWHLAFSTLATFNIELARKMRPRGNEKARDSYSWRLGIGPVSFLYAVAVSLCVVFALIVVSNLGLSAYWLLPPLALLIVALFVVYNYSRSADTRYSDRVLLATAGIYLVSHLSIVLGSTKW
jgi:4-hydroxybenzoate polyprenyltransferase